MEEIFDKLYPQYNGELAKVLVCQTIAQPTVKAGLLDQFTNNDMPRIAISVDADTGIDVREIVNPFAKPLIPIPSSGRWSGAARACWKTSKTQALRLMKGASGFL